MSARIEVDGVQLAYRETGRGPAVVLVHGLGGSAAGWRAQAEALAGSGRWTIAVDLRGAGESDKPAGPYSVERWAADVVAMIDALAIEETALVGHSVGTMVAEHAALALGERCRALALLGGALAWPPAARPAFEQRAELARSGRLREVAEAVARTGLTARAHAERPELVREMVEMIASGDPDAYAEAALATGRGSMRTPERIVCTTLAFCGAEDPVTPPQACERIAAAVAHGSSAVIEGGAHWCHLERPDAVSAALIELLDAAG